jgi:UDP-N-acetylmuramate: L-alanyl-gamma-D-glutamyl-meso-diaminopimelate ligase
VAAIVDALEREVTAGDVVAILSNGGFDGIYEKLPARLERRVNAAVSQDRVTGA